MDEDGQNRFDNFGLTYSKCMTADGPKDRGSSDHIRTAAARAERLRGDEKDAFLKSHNDERTRLNLDPLTWSDELASYALQWVDENKLAYVDSAIGTDITAQRNLPPLKHRPLDVNGARKYGENAFGSWASPPNPGLVSPGAVSSWLSEKGAFDTLNNQKPYVVGDANGKTDHKGNPIVVGHYTQIIWKDTKKVGAAKLVCRTTDVGTKDADKNETEFVVIFSNYDRAGNVTGQSPNPK
jgi:hypothetical protein